MRSVGLPLFIFGVCCILTAGCASDFKKLDEQNQAASVLPKDPEEKVENSENKKTPPKPLHLFRTRAVDEVLDPVRSKNRYRNPFPHKKQGP